MAVLRVQENIKKDDGTYDTVHKETEAGLVLFDQTEVKEAPAEGDYIPILDSADNEQMKKFPASVLVAATEGKADKSVWLEKVLYADGWTEQSGRLVQSIAVDGLTSSGNAMVGRVAGMSREEISVMQDAELSVLQQKTGAIVIAADGQEPQINLPVLVVLFG